MPALRLGFVQVLRGEWTKFRTLRSTALCVLTAVVLTVLLSLFGASASGTDSDGAPSFTDRFHFVHQPLAGDGTVIARVATQQPTNEWAKAGIMIKDGARHGSPYAAIMVTPEHGVRLEAMFTTQVSGGAGGAPQWLKLTRTGTSIAGFSSSDGRSWREVGTVTVDALPRTARAGLFVSSPSTITTVRVEGGGSQSQDTPTTGSATFDNVTVAPPAASWVDDEIFFPGAPPPPEERGSSARSGGTFTVTGTGDVTGYGIASWQLSDDDTVITSLSGVQLGLLAVVALSVLFMTSEYKTGTIRTTFLASPRRGRVLAAKAIVLGGAVFLTGLVASAAAFLITQPTLRANGYRPPRADLLSLTDGPVLRAVFGTALVLAVLAVFSLGVAAVRRRAVGALVIVITLMIVPQIIAPIMSLNAGQWINRLTPVAGLAIQQSKERFDTAIEPWAGFGVLCGYAVVALFLAFWRLRGRDA